MRILVTGATSRQANPDASNVGKKEVAFAWLLAEALRTNGYEVEHRNPTVSEDYADFDHIFVGLAPLHGLGSNRMYGVLAAVLRTWGTDRLSLFVDDPDVGKVTGGLRTMATEPHRVTKPFFAYKLEYTIASEPKVAAWLQEGVKILHEQQWPRLVVPGHTWLEDIALLESRVPQAAGQIVPLDLTTFLPDLKPVYEHDDEVPELKRQWVCEAAPDSKWFRQQRPGFDVHRIGKDGEKSLPDKHLVKLYAESWGVLLPPLQPVGWWSSRIGYAAQAGTPLVTKWQDVIALGEPYSVLTDAVVAMTPDERNDLATEQREALEAHTAPKDKVLEQLTGIITTTGATV